MNMETAYRLNIPIPESQPLKTADEQILYTNDNEPLYTLKGDKEVKAIISNNEVIWERAIPTPQSGVTPLSFRATRAKPLLDWSITGKTYQAWTPSPEPQVGNNKLDNSKIEKSSTITNFVYTDSSVSFGSMTVGSTINSAEIKSEDTSYAFSFSGDTSKVTFALRCYNSSHTYIGDANKIFDEASRAVMTLLSNTAYIRLVITSTVQGNVSLTNLMLNKGNTVMVFEPFGYLPNTGACPVQGVGDYDSVTGKYKIPVVTQKSYSIGEFEQGSLDGTNGNPIEWNSRIRTKDFLFLNSGTYTIQASLLNGNAISTFVFEYDADTDKFIKRTPNTWTEIPYTFTLDKPSKIKFLIAKGKGDDVVINTNEIKFVEVLGEPKTSTIYLNSPLMADEVLSSEYKQSAVNLFNSSTCTNQFVNTDGTISANNFYRLSEFIPVGKALYITATKKSVDSFRIIRYDENKNFVSRSDYSTVNDFEVNDAAYIRINANVDHWDISSITVNGLTNREVDYVYLTLNGSENWTLNSNGHVFVLADLPLAGGWDKDPIHVPSIKCSHFKTFAFDDLNVGGVLYGISHGWTFNDRISIRKYDIEGDISAFKSWLAEQHTNGTPLVVSYPLLNPTTEIVDVPQIPTLKGNNVIDVDTEVKPKNMSVKYLSSVEPKIYGFNILKNVSDPVARVVYTDDAVGMTPAGISGADTFSYGSWGDAFFMPRPCMIKSNGTVDYYLNPNNFKEKLDGTASDVTNLAYDGNAMMEWDKIYWKYIPANNEIEGGFRVSNYKVDDTYHCWCNINNNDKEVDHFYTNIYNGTGTNKLRSMSGVQISPTNGNGYTDVTTETTRAQANGTGWYIETWADRLLMTGLLLLMGKSTNTQAVFGAGLTGGGQADKEAYITGTLDDKGLFYGSTDTKTAVKCFGMENFYGCIYHRVAGCIISSYKLLTKLTWGKADGSTVVGYNQNGSGYVETTTSATTNGYVKAMNFTERGFVASDTTGSTTTYYCDYTYLNNGIRYLLVGGRVANGMNAGACCFSLAAEGSASIWDAAAALSFKPLV